jgi:hypothetical protein
MWKKLAIDNIPELLGVSEEEYENTVLVGDIFNHTRTRKPPNVKQD